MEIRSGEYSSDELIARTPGLQAIREEFARWKVLRDTDRGEVRELINLAAICTGLWEIRGCKEGDLAIDLAQRFLQASGVVGTEEQLRLAGAGTLGDGMLEYAREAATCARAALAALENHQRAVEYFSHEVFGQSESEWVPVATALVVDGLEGLKDWRDPDVVHPVGYVRTRAKFIKLGLREHGTGEADALSLTHQGDLVPMDALTPTGDSYAAMLPNSSRADWDSDIHTRTDLENVCRKSGLSRDAQLFALSRYLGLPRDRVSEFLPIEAGRVEAARKKFDRQTEEIQEGLRDYREPRKKVENSVPKTS